MSAKHKPRPAHAWVPVNRSGYVHWNCARVHKNDMVFVFGSSLPQGWRLVRCRIEEE